MAALLCLGAAAPDAGATLRIANHNDPAGDPTVMTYRLESPTWSASPFDFQLPDGDFRSFGVVAGSYTARALLPPGWRVGDIQCVGPRPEDFMIDVANGAVTIRHGEADEHTCSFTNRRVPPGGDLPPAPGIAPAPPPAELPKVVLPRRPAVLGVKAGRRFAEATVRVTRRALIKGRLVSRGGGTVGGARMTRRAGTHVLRVSLRRERVRQMRRRGMREALLTLRVAVVHRNGATWAFRHGVLVSL